MKRLALATMRPTQMTVGMDYVNAKALITARFKGDELEQFMREHAIKIVVGPDGEPFIVDHHHWARAWHNLGHIDAPVTVVAELRNLERARFWQKMERKGWAHPFDEHGIRRGIDELPLCIGDLADDPYHSLAAFARRAGAYRKPKGAYASFVWADFLRQHVRLAGKDAGAFSLALLQSIRVARSKAATSMPGYIAPGRH
jgi:hypothetical protein